MDYKKIFMRSVILMAGLWPNKNNNNFIMNLRLQCVTKTLPPTCFLKVVRDARLVIRNNDNTTMLKEA